MSKTDKKLAVLLALKHYGKPVAMRELLALLEAGESERSVRRWLNELETEGLVIKTGKKKGMRYQTADLPSTNDSIAENKETAFKFDAASSEAINYLQQPVYLRKPKTYQKVFFDAYQPNVSFYLSEARREQLREHGARSHNQDIAGTYARHIYNRLLIDLSYNSSRLEGNTYSLLDTEKLIIEDKGAVNKTPEEKIMIQNHKEAIRYLIDNASKLEFSVKEICTLHYLLADGLLPPTQAGNFRNSAVKIGGSSYLPLDNAARIKAMMELICQKANNIQDPFEQSFFSLVHIAYLQAFEDCNKRTSRLAANIPFIRENLVPLSFSDISKEDYSSAIIAVYELNDVAPLAELFCFSYLRTCDQYGTNIESMGIDKIRINYREQRRKIIGHIVAENIHGELMQDYIKLQIQQIIPEVDQEAFKNAVLEDLELLNPSRIVGMGITVQQLKKWQSL